MPQRAKIIFKNFVVSQVSVQKPQNLNFGTFFFEIIAASFGSPTPSYRILARSKSSHQKTGSAEPNTDQRAMPSRHQNLARAELKRAGSWLGPPLVPEALMGSKNKWTLIFISSISKIKVHLVMNE